MKTCCVTASLLGLLASPAFAQDLPGLPPAGNQAFQLYQKAAAPRAFAIAPGGSWGWHAGADSSDVAEDKALSACQSGTHQKCVLYARDGEVVFNARAWPGLWGPYATAAAAARAAPGVEPGQRLADLAFRDAQGRSTRLSALRGKVVVLHFWGSWCPPCRKEMPELAGLRQALGERRDIAFVLLQAREPFATAQRWARNQNLTLPLADSGSTGEDDTDFRLADGGRLADRLLARSFPTTYVLDKHGLVLFSHVGPLHDWRGYEAFLRDAARHSGK
ncbi:MAG: TlpA family protein disulfide reductase [Dechloromonas sp.]|nr:TlpA family protein disulfide reductase [Dechloromonas sp.]